MGETLQALLNVWTVPWRPFPIRVVCSLVIAAVFLAAVLVEVFLMAASAGVYRGWG
jgi:hypothetical protein